MIARTQLTGRAVTQVRTPRWPITAHPRHITAAWVVTITWTLVVFFCFFIQDSVPLLIPLYPRNLVGLFGIVTAPLMHGNWDHILSNMVGGIPFSFAIALSGKKTWAEVTLTGWLVGGGLLWLVGPGGTGTVGASGVIYTWMGYYIVRGLFNRSVHQIAVGLVFAAWTTSAIWGIFPLTAGEGVSWQAHLLGLILGIVCAAFITADDPPETIRRRHIVASMKRRRHKPHHPVPLKPIAAGPNQIFHDLIVTDDHSNQHERSSHD